MLLLALTAAAATPPRTAVEGMVAAWRRVSSYRCLQVIQERVDGELLDEQRMRVAFRKPWEVQLTWETVHEGRKAYWSASRDGGDVLVYPGGLTGRALGVLSFSPDNPILKGDTRHSLAEAGFGYLAEKIGKVFAGGANAGLLTVARETATELTLAVGEVQGMEHQRAELTVSTRTSLPIAFSGWDAQGQLLERFAWTQVALDVPLDERIDFDVAYGR